MASVIEKAVTFMVGIANDASHGYDQQYRWGERGDYDCSSLVITSWQQAGVGVKSKGATYTGNMYNVFRLCGFEDVTASCNLKTGAGMQRGDVLLNHVHHTAMYIGNGQLVQASINELGKATGGKPGDQKQLRGQRGEINVRGYYNYPWNKVLRYKGAGASSGSSAAVVDPMSKGYLQQGDVGESVRTMQRKLIAVGFSCGSTGADASFGPATVKAVKAFQKSRGLTQDGSYGPKTQAALNNAYNSLNKSASKIILAVDKSWGPATTKRTQQYFGTVMDGVISNQCYCDKRYLANCSSTTWEWISNGRPGGSSVIKKLQAMVGVKQDGYCGKNTVIALQKYLKNKGYYKGSIDGSMGPGTVEAWQRFLNDH